MRKVRPVSGAGHQERVEHPAAVLLMVGQAAAEQGRALATGRDIQGAGGLGTVDLGHFGSEQDSPAEHRACVGPGPAAGEVSRPRIGPGRGVEPARLERAEGDVDLQDRPA